MLDSLAEQRGIDRIAAERSRLRENAERALLQLALVVLEEDEDAQRTFRSCRNSTIRSAAFPSSSSLSVSPRAGGAASA
jgi:hypothetical protein